VREFVALPLVVACSIATIMCSRQDDWERVMDEDPAWSPDGDQIAFVRRDSTGCGLYLVDSSGRNERLLLEGE
jgi:Tol biopolymer transport system component